MRYILEGAWSGYTSAQTRVVHREVIKTEKGYQRVKDFSGIRYPDGTRFDVFIRPAKPREKVQEIRGYPSFTEWARCYAVKGYHDVQAVNQGDPTRKDSSDAAS